MVSIALYFFVKMPRRRKGIDHVVERLTKLCGKRRVHSLKSKSLSCFKGRYEQFRRTCMLSFFEIRARLLDRVTYVCFPKVQCV